MDILGNVEPPLILQLTVDGPNFVEFAVAAIMSRFRNLTRFHFAPSRAVRHLCSIAEAIKVVFFTRACTKAREIRPVPVRAEANQIAGVASGTFHAMAKAKRHLMLIQATGPTPGSEGKADANTGSSLPEGQV